VIAGTPEANADLLHATRFFAPGVAAWFQVRGRSYLLVNDLDLVNARRESRVGTVLSVTPYQHRLRRQVKAPDFFHGLAAALKERRVSRAIVPRSFPAGAAGRLTEAGIRVRIAPDPFLRSRIRKTPLEVRRIRQVLRAAEAGMATGVLTLSESRIGRDGYLYRDGHRLTAEALRDRIDAAIFAAGATPAHSIVAGGSEAADPHARGTGPLPAHRPIVLDLFPRSRSTGYYADITRTVVRGRSDPRTRAAFLAVATAQEMALQTIRPGVDGADVHRLICAFFEKAGFPSLRRGRIREGFFHGLGHGLGLELHEYPTVHGRSSRLEAGQVITVEPGLYYRKLGGIRLEDVVLVTRTGCRKLTRFPTFLEMP